MTNLKSGPITITLSIEDLSEVGFDTRLVTQKDLQNLASKLGDAYLDNSFFQDIEWYGDLHRFPRI